MNLCFISDKLRSPVWHGGGNRILRNRNHSLQVLLYHICRIIVAQATVVCISLPVAEMVMNQTHGASRSRNGVLTQCPEGGRAYGEILYRTVRESPVSTLNVHIVGRGGSNPAGRTFRSPLLSWSENDWAAVLLRRGALNDRPHALFPVL